MSKRFQRRVEDFTCENCGEHVSGDGYTNHCPQCLWSKHVDINPGDRAAQCGGLMEPVGVESTGGAYTILHRCSRCGLERPNRSRKEDSFEALLKLTPTCGTRKKKTPSRI